VPEQSAPDPWAYRASDTDRDTYLTLLREAYAEGRLDAAEYEERMSLALAAKTYSDLLPVLQDLPVDTARLPRPPMAASPYPVPAQIPQPPLPGGLNSSLGLSMDNTLLAIFSSSSRRGVWQVPESQSALALFGDVKIDLSEAILPGQVTELKCYAILGSVQIIVPDALNVEVNGVGVFGSFEQRDKRKGANKQRVPAAGAPLIKVTGAAVFGEVEVRVVTPKQGSSVVRVMNQPLPKAPLMPPPAPPQLDAPPTFPPLPGPPPAPPSPPPVG
jgi:hypothetical protein